MKKYTYYFCDGTSSTIELEDYWVDLLLALDEKERKSNRKETRRHVSFEKLVDDGISFEDINADFVKKYFLNEDNSELKKILLKHLSKKQFNVVKHIIFNELNQIETAEIEGVSQSAICQRLENALKKIKNIL